MNPIYGERYWLSNADRRHDGHFKVSEAMFEMGASELHPALHGSVE
jgi:hypothetical protein